MIFLLRGVFVGEKAIDTAYFAQFYIYCLIFVSLNIGGIALLTFEIRSVTIIFAQG